MLAAVGQDRRLPRGLRLLLAVVALRHRPRKAADDEDARGAGGRRQRAKAAGATRFCMGAAWREVKDGPAFDEVLEMVRGVRALGMEACCTLGHARPRRRPQRLAEAGLTAYNHNLDTSRSYYKSIITTRTYDDRLTTLAKRAQGRHHRLLGRHHRHGRVARRPLQPCWRRWPTSTRSPRACPSTRWRRSSGTPLGERRPVDPLELVRMIATARILMPKARVRLSAGRLALTREAQVLCFLAGANSIFYGEKLLTTGNPDVRPTARCCATPGCARQPSKEPPNDCRPAAVARSYGYRQAAALARPLVEARTRRWPDPVLVHADSRHRPGRVDRGAPARLACAGGGGRAALPGRARHHRGLSPRASRTSR